VVVGNPLDTRNDTRVRSRSALVENLDTDDLDGLGNAVGASTDGTRAVSSVSVLISVLSIKSVRIQKN